MGDTAYGEVDNRVACAERGIDLISRVPTPKDPEVAKSAFEIDEVAGTLTCPGGQSVEMSREARDPAGRPVKQFAFAQKTCVDCQFFSRCVRSKTEGRRVTLNYYEDVMRAARQRQETAEFREAYRERSKVERKIAELVGQGLRQARYVGRKKKRLQALWTAAAVNLKRLFKLAKGDTALIGEVLKNLSTARPTLKAAKTGY